MAEPDDDEVGDREDDAAEVDAEKRSHRKPLPLISKRLAGDLLRDETSSNRRADWTND
jgi:hypothetical protein